MFKKLGSKIINFEVLDKKTYEGVDGEYEIDVSIKFEMFGGVQYLTFLECKSYKKGHNVDRDKIMILNQKLESLGAQKGIILTTSDFQEGAVEFATKHGIALIKICDESMMIVTKGYADKTSRGLTGKLMGVYEYIQNEGRITYSVVRQEIKDKILEIPNINRGGDGGQIFIISEQINGDGLISTDGGSGEVGGNAGKVHIESKINNYSGTISAKGGKSKIK